MTLPAPYVHVRDVCYAYAQADVLHDVSADLRGGEVVAIAGPNGSGKSTLIELIAGVLTPRRGRVECSGDLALVLQKPEAPAALPLTVRDVVAMGLWKRGRRARRLRDRASVDRAVDRVGMADLADRPLASLSGGQRQRTFIAQGIVREPDILLLDEPSAGLDRESVARTREILAQEAARGAVVVSVTHDETAVHAADHAIRLDRGVVQSTRASRSPAS